MRDISTFLENLTRWTVTQNDVAVLLVGSFARGTARDDSDVDVILITVTPQRYLQDEQWFTTFGQVVQVQDEDWGLVQSRRVLYADGIEVEFGITTPQWANIDPVDDGTQRVIADGAQIVCDLGGMLAALLRVVNAESD